MSCYNVEVNTDELFQFASNAPSLERWEQFWGHVEIRGVFDCWNWTGARQKNRSGKATYGITRVNSRNYGAHRLICIWLYGDMPSTLLVDHVVCSNPPCINPLHLIPTSPRINNLRSASKCNAAINARKTHCKNGHELTGANIYSFPSRKDRLCKACHRAWKRDRWNKGLDRGTARYKLPNKKEANAVSTLLPQA